MKRQLVGRSNFWVARLAALCTVVRASGNSAAGLAARLSAGLQHSRSSRSEPPFLPCSNLQRSRKHGQAYARLLELCKDMSLSLFVRKAVICTTLAVAFPGLLSAQSSYTTSGAQYAIAGALPGDQAHPRLAINSTGGFVVWEDNRTDGDGLGISARGLDSGLSGKLSTFQVNEIATGDQERPQVALLKDGGAVFVWQGGKLGFQHIYARFLASDNTWRTGDILVSDSTKEYQVNPVVTVLAGGNVVVLYTSMNQYSATSMKDIYGQVFSPAGEKIGAEFLVNQFSAYNQRSPAAAALPAGGFVVVWVSEMQRGTVGDSNPGTIYPGYSAPNVDIYARIYSASGAPTGNEMMVNTGSAICANPVISASSSGSFVVAWSSLDPQVLSNSWDIYSRRFSNVGVGSSVARANTQTLRDQFDPQLGTSGGDFLLIWNSLSADSASGSVRGQFLKDDGTLSGNEFKVNTAALGEQIQPSVASDSAGRFLVAWTGFTGIATSFDVLGQRYFNTAQPLPRMDAPFVYVPFDLAGGSYVPTVQVSWPLQAGLTLDHYEVFVNGASAPAASLTNNTWVAAGLAPATTYTFSVCFVTVDGRRSELSPAASVKTWTDLNWAGIPFEWMTANYGTDLSKWPAADTSLSSDGPTLVDVFISGGNPKNPNTWLRTQLVTGQDGIKLSWNPQPGRTYQVQSTTDLVHWNDLGGKRFAAGAEDKIPVANGNTAYYRVVLMR